MTSYEQPPMFLTSNSDPGQVATAVLSSDGTYRYRLTRQWEGGDRVIYVMLNPSTADALVDDPTIRRCISFAKREGFAGIEVVNLFAYRTPFPSALVQAARDGVDIIGPANNTHIQTATAGAPLIIAAWGAHQHASPERVAAVQRLIDKPLYCLGIAKNGAPRHPGRLAAATPLTVWAGLAA